MFSCFSEFLNAILKYFRKRLRFLTASEIGLHVDSNSEEECPEHSKKAIGLYKTYVDVIFKNGDGKSILTSSADRITFIFDLA